MNPIPIAAYGYLISSSVSFLIALRLYISLRKDKGNQPLNYFFKFFLLLGIFWSPLINASPLVSRNPYFLAVSHDLAIPLLYIALAYLIIIPLYFLGWFKLKNIIYWFFLLMSASLAIINLSNFKFALSSTAGEYIYWVANIPLYVRAITGYITPAVALITIIFFIVEASLTKQKYVWGRSLFISLGVLLMALASISHFLIGAPRGSFSYVVLSNILTIGGLILILAGVYYKGLGLKIGARRVNNF